MLSADRPDNYVEAMEKHIEGDKEISKDDLNKVENTINGHAVMFQRFLKIGNKWDQQQRVKEAMISKGGKVPKLFGLRKDHKTIPAGQKEKGPPTRPVCGASSSINGQLSHLISEILNRLADSMENITQTECKSQEEMIASIESVNRLVDNEDIAVWSSDVKALYPSLQTDIVAETIANEYLKSNLEINVNYEELGLYLALVMSKEEIEEAQFEEITAQWKYEGHGQKPGITTAEVMARTNGHTKFNNPVRQPNKDEERKMMAMAIKHGITVVMRSHTYHFNGKIYLQTEGGPIGLELTGAISRVYMSWWDKELMKKINDATEGISWKLLMYQRYVDDENCIGEVMPLGARLENGKVSINPEMIDNDRSIPPDIRTAKIIKDIANSISPCIEVEIDCPSLHENKKMPILDLEVWVEGNQVMYQFYRKPMSNFLVLMARSAMSMKMKRICLMQEVVRTLRNTKRSLPEEVKTNFLSEFALRMKDSGYTCKFRKEVIEGGVKAYEKQVVRDETGQCPLYRPKGYKKDERAKKKAISKVSWYKPFDTVLFCPPTPGSRLANSLKTIAKDIRDKRPMNIHVVERAGVALKTKLPGLKEQEECLNTKEDCIIHKHGGKGNCRASSVVYKGECITCRERGPSSMRTKDGTMKRIPRADRKPGTSSIYIGESSRSAFMRGKDHFKALRNPTDNTSNGFCRHMVECHRGVKNVKFKVDVVGTYKKPLERLISEGVEIYRAKPDILMNSKLDHYQPAIGKMVVTNAPQ